MGDLDRLYAFKVAAFVEQQKAAAVRELSSLHQMAGADLTRATDLVLFNDALTRASDHLLMGELDIMKGLIAEVESRNAPQPPSQPPERAASVHGARSLIGDGLTPLRGSQRPPSAFDDDPTEEPPPDVRT